MSLQDEIFMREALKEAKKAAIKQEVPVGAVLTFQGKIIARAHNLVETKRNAACHAELLCLQKCAKQFKNWRLLDCTLYCTLEPCAMCAGAMMLFRIKRLVYGAPDLRHGAHESLFSILSLPHPIHQIEIVKGVCKEEAAYLMKDFFVKRRENARSFI